MEVLQLDEKSGPEDDWDIIALLRASDGRRPPDPTFPLVDVRTIAELASQEVDP